MSGAGLRVALLCHSVNPRGGVMHALELAAALARLGHEPVVHAPDPDMRGFFRRTDFETVSVPARPVAGGGVYEMAAERAEDYRRYFRKSGTERFDVFHAEDGISGTALANLGLDGLVGGFVRTVHHLDDFPDPRLEAMQTRSVTAAAALCVVSEAWRAELRARFGLAATTVGNGVDTARFRPAPDGREAALRARLGLATGPVILAVGGVEARKNTRRILEAFRRIGLVHGGARLVVAGGASLLDHTRYRAEFEHDLAASDLPAEAVLVTGPLADDDMPALFRLADVLAFPSLREGFGLVALEAMASGVPVVVPRAAPFDEYLAEGEAAWCDPLDPGSIADALLRALAEPLRSDLAERGRAVARRHGWERTAAAHLELYARLREASYA